MLDVSVVEKPCRKKRNRRGPIEFFRPIRQSRCQRRAQMTYRHTLRASPLESNARKRQDQTLRVEVPVAQDVLQAAALNDLRGEQAPDANPLIPRLPTVHKFIVSRIRVANGVATAGTYTQAMANVVDMGKPDDIIAMIGRMAFINHVACQGSNAAGRSIFGCGCNKSCNSSPSSIRHTGCWEKYC